MVAQFSHAGRMLVIPGLLVFLLTRHVRLLADPTADRPPRG